MASGLDSPHLLSDVAFSKHYSVNQTVYVATDGGGVYVSSNGGSSWSSFSDGLQRFGVGKILTIGDVQNQVLLAAGVVGGLFVTKTDVPGWQRVMSDDVQITALLEVANDSGTVVIAGDSNGGVWQSDLDLQSWRRLFILPDSGSITSFASTPTGDSQESLYIGTSAAGLLATADSGATFVNLSKHWPVKTRNCRGALLDVAIADRHVRDIEVVQLQNHNTSLYVSTSEHAVHYSSDGGTTWETRNAGITCDDQADSPTFSVPHFRDLELAGLTERDLFVAGFNGLYRSSDNGNSWTALETLPVSLMRGFNRSAAENGKHALAITTYGAGAYVSDDNGETWRAENRGLVSTRLSDIEFSPTYWDDGSLYSASRARLLSRSDKSDAWTAEFIGYRGWRRTIGYGLERQFGINADYGRRLFLDPHEISTPWATAIALSPNFATDRIMFAGFRRHGIWKSDDAGKTWNRNWDGPINWITSLEASPNYAQDKTVFAAIRGAGIYVSRDGANSWQSVNSGIEGPESTPNIAATNYISDPPLRQALEDVHLAVSPNYTADQTVFASSSRGLYKTSNSGTSWDKLLVVNSAERQAISAIGISPEFASDKTLMVSVQGKGLYRSVDGGASFADVKVNSDTELSAVNRIRFSPAFAEDRRIYSATEETLLVSDDVGVSWRVISRPVRYEDWRGATPGPMRFRGEWERESGLEFGASSQTVTSQLGATATFEFFGSQLVWYGERGPDAGIANLSLDGAPLDPVDLYSPHEETGAEIARLSNLEKIPHRIVIEVSANKNNRSSGNRVSLDWFEQSSGTWEESNAGRMQ